MGSTGIAVREDDWKIVTDLVLDGISSPHTRRAYSQALDEFLIWFRDEPNRLFNKATVQKYRAELEAKGLAPSSINVRLSAIRRLALVGSTFMLERSKITKKSNISDMSQLERIYKLDRMLRRKQPPKKRDVLDVLEISPAQFKRDIEFMRDRLGAPVAFDAETAGYRYSNGEFNLPGLWFSEPEVYALLLVQALLDKLQPGIVRDQLKPFETKLRGLLGKSAPGADSILDRIEVNVAPQRPVDPTHFQAICDATLRRKQLKMSYYSRYRGTESERTVSPQRVIYYRGNWYLDAWCHEKMASRRFAVDAVRSVSVLDERAKETSAELSGTGQHGYGIFAGPAEQVAVLIFDPVAARWVGEEEWHPEQRLTTLPNDSVQLVVPYSHPQEIMMDILRHGPHVEVVRPASLRSAVADSHREAAEKYALPKRSMVSAKSAAVPRVRRAH
jgi:predicted DNA-binding transcriptional regulator YafY